MKIELTHINKEAKNLIQAALNVIQTLQANGYEAYIVGGAVRNILLKQDINDIDITTNCLPDDMINIFDRTVPVGIEHGTVLVLTDDYQFEVTTFRIDGEYKDHRRPDEVQFVAELKADLERRDFTINALAIDQQYNVIDYFNGQNDLTLRMIKAVGNPDNRFQEDALRMMRAIRFMSVLDFEIEDKTLHAIHNLAHLIQHVSIERIIVEMKKLMQGSGVHQALSIFYEDLYQHIPFFKHIKSETDNYLITSSTNLYTYIAYIIYSEQQFENTLLLELTTLKLSNREVKRIKGNVKLFEYFAQPNISLALLCYRYPLEDIQAVLQYISQERLAFANVENSAFVEHTYQALPIKSRSELAIDGHRLMTALDKPAGPWLKTMLLNIEQAVVEGQLKNNQNEILEWAKQYVEV